MRAWAILLAAGWAVLGTAATASSAKADPPAYYVGGGVRAGLNDSTAAALNSKIQVADLGDFTLSARPGLFVGSEVEGRLPLTVETSLDEVIHPYGGAGLAYNTDGLSTVDPMLTAGVDVAMNQNLVLDLKLNVIFQTSSSDTDAELVGTLNYAF